MKKLISISRTFLLTFALATIPASSLAAPAPATASGATEEPDHITLTWSQDPLTSQTITWRTAPSVVQGMVQFAPSSDKINFANSAKTVNASVRKLTTDLGEMNLHTVILQGLKPGTTYVYRVGDGSRWSDLHTFTTEASNTQSFKFLIFGDSQSGDAQHVEYGPWKKTVQQAFQANPDAKFMVNVGDLVEWGQSYAHWNQWFDAVKGVIDTIPEMAVQGNHETYNPPAGQSGKPIFWLNQFPLPQNGPDSLKGQAYSYDYGPAHIVVLDSQEEEEKPIVGDILQPQKTWLEEDLKKTNKPWKLVFFHKTPYYNKATRTNETIKKAFQPIFDKYHVDVVFNGHDHAVARTYPIYQDRLVDSPAKGTVYYVTGRSGNKYYTDLSRKVWDAFFYDPQDQPNYIVAEVSASRLTLRAIKQDGTPIDTYTIDKEKQTDFPRTSLPGRYNTPMMAIFGNLVQPPMMTTPPRLVNGKWYVPVRPFIAFLGGDVTWQQGIIGIQYGKMTVELSVKGKSAKVNGQPVTLPDPILEDKGISLISADDLRQLFGFQANYDATTNILMLSK